jgi:hypothetical protein
MQRMSRLRRDRRAAWRAACIALVLTAVRPAAAATPDLVATDVPPAASAEQSIGALPARMEELRARYDVWLNSREPVAYDREVPALPEAAALPPLPDAPGGEISDEHGAEEP